jgi:hypothetical protein
MRRHFQVVDGDVHVSSAGRKEDDLFPLDEIKRLKFDFCRVSILLYGGRRVHLDLSEFRPDELDQLRKILEDAKKQNSTERRTDVEPSV